MSGGGSAQCTVAAPEVEPEPVTVLGRYGLEKCTCECVMVVKRKCERLLPLTEAAWWRIESSAHGHLRSLSDVRQPRVHLGRALRVHAEGIRVGRHGLPNCRCGGQAGNKMNGALAVPSDPGVRRESRCHCTIVGRSEERQRRLKSRTLVGSPLTRRLARTVLLFAHGICALVGRQAADRLVQRRDAQRPRRRRPDRVPRRLRTRGVSTHRRRRVPRHRGAGRLKRLRSPRPGCPGAQARQHPP